MNKLKKIMIALIIFMFSIVLFIIILINSKNSNTEETGNELNHETELTSMFSPIKDYKTYYTIKEIINNYIVYMKQVNGDKDIEYGKLNITENEAKETLQKEGINAIKALLDQQYIKDLSINDNAIKLAQDKYKQNGKYDKEVTYNLNIEDIVEGYIDDKISVVLVSGKLNNIDLKLMIKLDKINNTYSIFLEDYIEKYGYSKDMSKEEVNINKNKIEINNFNSRIKVEPSEFYIVSQYFSEYKEKMINDTKKAYELLNEEYRQQKYSTYEKFEEYVKNNQENIAYASIDKYQVIEKNGTKEYVCIDKRGKYYIFIEKNITNYEVILDTYTVDLPTFLEKYNNSEEQIKCGMNIQKIFDAINDEDYNYVYQKLDNSFKQNNFPNLEMFEEYVKQNFYNKQVSYERYEKSGELYIYEIILNSEIDNKQNGTKKTFIVKLLDKTDFIFSFNVK